MYCEAWSTFPHMISFLFWSTHTHIYISITYVYTRCIYSCQLKIKTKCTHILTVSFDDITKRKIFCLFVYMFSFSFGTEVPLVLEV